MLILLALTADGIQHAEEKEPKSGENDGRNNLVPRSPLLHKISVRFCTHIRVEVRTFAVCLTGVLECLVCLLCIQILFRLVGSGWAVNTNSGVIDLKVSIRLYRSVNVKKINEFISAGSRGLVQPKNSVIILEPPAGGGGFRILDVF